MQDEDGIPFWGGARRRPHPLNLNMQDAAHKAFIDASVKLWFRAYVSIDRSAAELCDTSVDESFVGKTTYDVNEIITAIDAFSRKSIAQIIDPMVRMLQIKLMSICKLTKWSCRLFRSLKRMIYL